MYRGIISYHEIVCIVKNKGVSIEVHLLSKVPVYPLIPYKSLGSRDGPSCAHFNPAPLSTGRLNVIKAIISVLNNGPSDEYNGCWTEKKNGKLNDQREPFSMKISLNFPQ